MKVISKPLNAFIHAMFGRLDSTGMAWARVGIVVLVVAALMSYDFGTQVSWKHGAFLAALSFAAAFGPEVAYKVYEEGKSIVAGIIGICAIGLLTIEFYSHHAYTAGIRGNNVAETRVANVKYDGAQDGVAEAKVNLEMWTKQLATLQDQAPWVATVKADALRDQIANADKYVKNEADRGGCKQKCEARMRERDGLAKQLAAVEQREDFTKRIEAAKAIIDKARAKADSTEFKSSAVVHSNNSLARIVSFLAVGDEHPSEKIAAGADISANLAMAIAGTGLPAFCLFIAGLYRRPETEDERAALTMPSAARPMAASLAPQTSLSDMFAERFAKAAA